MQHCTKGGAPPQSPLGTDVPCESAQVSVVTHVPFLCMPPTWAWHVGGWSPGQHGATAGQNRFGTGVMPDALQMSPGTQIPVVPLAKHRPLEGKDGWLWAWDVVTTTRKSRNGETIFWMQYILFEIVGKVSQNVGDVFRTCSGFGTEHVGRNVCTWCRCGFKFKI